jgi:hypothetical protein
VRNYIPDQNRFHLATPPTWWLKQLNEFDSSLYVVPSRQGHYYRLAQKRPLDYRAKIVNDLLVKQGDTAMLASYSLIPVTTIIANPSWSQAMFQELTERAPWRQGGAAKVIKRLEEAEAQRDAKKEAVIDDNLTERAKDGYKLYKAKTGQRTFVSHSRIKLPNTAPMKGYALKGGLFVPSETSAPAEHAPGRSSRER